MLNPNIQHTASIVFSVAEYEAKENEVIQFSTTFLPIFFSFSVSHVGEKGTNDRKISVPLSVMITRPPCLPRICINFSLYTCIDLNLIRPANVYDWVIRKQRKET